MCSFRAFFACFALDILRPGVPAATCLPPTHNQGPYDTSLSVTRHKKRPKAACHEDLTPPQAGAHHTPPPARHRLTSGSSGRARLAMIASQVGFRLGLGLASPKRKGTRRQHCLRSWIRENSFNCTFHFSPLATVAPRRAEPPAKSASSDDGQRRFQATARYAWRQRPALSLIASMPACRLHSTPTKHILCRRRLHASPQKGQAWCPKAFRPRR